MRRKHILPRNENDLTAFLLVMAIALSISSGAKAGMSFVSGAQTSDQDFANCKAEGHNVALCRFFSKIVDPSAIDVNSFSLSVGYDTSKYTFDASSSGPLGIFSVGGDTPPPDPGIGTQPLALLPLTGFNPGAPLPGSTLSYTDVGGVVTVNYTLASPVTSTGDINFFRLDFSLIHPIKIDLSTSTVTYETTGPGQDFTSVGFSCSTTSGLNLCGSENPSSGSTLHLSVVPEASTWVMLMLGFAGLGYLGYRASRKGAAVAA
jgi:hypothetical protein